MRYVRITDSITIYLYMFGSLARSFDEELSCLESEGCICLAGRNTGVGSQLALICAKTGSAPGF